MKRLHVHITILCVLCLKCLISCSQGDQIHVWEMVELTFEAETGYNNPYKEVDFWIQLRGPDFDKRVEGFWDGEKIFKARVTATRPGNWSWESYSNKPDPGLNGKKGCFTAISWTEEELLENPNRRGTIRPTANGRALEYADGNPPGDPQRDSYYGRAQAYGSLLSGGLAGHVYGSTSWMGIARGEPDMGTKAIRWWIPFSYPAFSQMKYTGEFMLSEGKAYQDLVLAGNDIIPGKSKGAVHTGLDGWAFMMRTKDKNLALLYFENGCEQAVLMNMSPGNEYRAFWFNPRNGEWYEAGNLVSDNMGNLKLPKFPSGRDVSEQDWGFKLVLEN